MQSKAKIFNLALAALLLSRRIVNVDTDQSNECKILELHYETAFNATLADLDLDSTSTQVTLELLEEEPNDLWLYAYKYPVKCAFFRRIVTASISDDRDSHIPKRIAIHEGKKVILTNEAEAIAECIMNDVPLTSLSATAGLAVALRLAILAAPTTTGKGAKALIESIEKRYIMTKAEAQRIDQLENAIFFDPEEESEFAKARLE